MLFDIMNMSLLELIQLKENVIILNVISTIFTIIMFVATIGMFIAMVIEQKIKGKIFLTLLVSLCLTTGIYVCYNLPSDKAINYAIMEKSPPPTQSNRVIYWR